MIPGREENTRTKHTQFRHVKSDIDILTANATDRHSAPLTLSSYRITGESQGGTESRIGSKSGRDDISATAHSDSQSYAVACGTDLMPVSMMPVTTPGDGGPMRNDPANRHREFNRDREFVACHASDPELYVSLQLLFHHEHGSFHHRAASSLQPALLQSLLESSPFTHLPLLPWFPYLRSCGVSEAAIQELQE